jgi:hypothetical protein
VKKRVRNYVRKLKVGEHLAYLEVDGRAIRMDLKEIEWMCGFILSASGLYTVAMFG